MNGKKTSKNNVTSSESYQSVTLPLYLANLKAEWADDDGPAHDHIYALIAQLEVAIKALERISWAVSVVPWAREASRDTLAEIEGMAK